MKLTTIYSTSLVALLATALVHPAAADSTDQVAQAAPAAPADAAPAAAPADAAPAPTALATPSMAGPIAGNTNPTKFDTDPLGTIYVSGFASGIAMVQGNNAPSDRKQQFDITNGQVAIQKTDGMLQFYVQAGIYDFPSLGTSYVRSGTLTSNTFGALPNWDLKLVPSDTFSVEIGYLPTLIGDEYTFSFQNMNVERGLLWNQEPAVSRGVQANLTTGPVAWAVSVNDGFFSNDFDWVSGSAAFTIDPTDTLAVVGGGNFSKSSTSTFVTPIAQNNGDVVNVIYTYNNAPWVISPYVQYTSVPKTIAGNAASTWGGALLVDFAASDTINIAGRVEYISSDHSGSAATATNLLYGPGSSAWSITLTPTYQSGIFFLRGEASYTGANSSSAGFVFGHNGNSTSQARLLVETGVVF